MIRAGFSEKDLNNFYRDLQVMKLTGSQKKKILLWTLKAIKRKSQKNIRNQQTPDGKNWAKGKPTEDGANKKLLRRVLKYASTIADERGKGRIRYKNPLSGEIALKQQEGFTEKIKIGFATDKNKKDQSGSKPATPQQAKRLRELGYRKRNGKGRNGKVKYRLYTMSEIRQNLTRTWASMLIRRLEGNDITSNKRAWGIHVPARPFLDMREEENIKILTEFTEKFLSGEYK